MRSLLFAAAFLLAAHAHAIAADSAAGWKGVKVLPKLDAVVKVGNETVDRTKAAFPLPWVVQDVKGEWLWVGDNRKGWVQRSQVVTLDEAPAYYTQVINSGKQKASAYYLRGITWGLKGDPDLAIADFGDVLRLSPSAETYICRGLVWSKKKEYEKAIADYNQAIRLDPNHAFAYNNRGRARFSVRDYDKAIADFNQSMRLDPNNSFVFSNAAWLRATCSDAQFRNGTKAVELATKACELAGWTRSEAVESLAAAYAETGDFDSAIKYQNKAIELNPTDAEFVKGAEERLALYKDHKPYREE